MTCELATKGGGLGLTFPHVNLTMTIIKNFRMCGVSSSKRIKQNLYNKVGREKCLCTTMSFDVTMEGRKEPLFIL